MSPDSGIFKHPVPSHTRIRLNADGTTTQLVESDPSPPNPFIEANINTSTFQGPVVPRITRENYNLATNALRELERLGRESMDDWERAKLYYDAKEELAKRISIFNRRGV